MLMMFSNSIRRLPLEKAMPYNDDDLIIIVEPTIAFRLVNMRSEKDEPFSIRFLMEKKEVFACTNFKVRIEQFADILDARIERYFETGKCDYIFFDREEQKQIQQVFNSTGLNCAVEVYTINKDGNFEAVEFAELSPVLSRKVIKHLNSLRVRGVLDVRNYHAYMVQAHKKQQEARKEFKKKNENMLNKGMGVYFKRYSKLKSLDSKDKVLKYFKLLLRKYHPDVSKIENAEDTFKIINEDLQNIKNSSWFNRLS